MHSALHFIQNIDLNIYYWLSQFHGNWYVDRFVAFQESNALLKCGLLASMYWYFWFREDSEQRQTRGRILAIFTGTLAGIVFARVVATLLPFRVRPMYAAHFAHNSLSIPTPTNFIDWSSFPSDHAAYLCALGFGLIWFSRRMTVPVVLFLAGWVCFPRMYMGIHYASDLIAGSAIGVAAVWFSLKAKWLESNLIPRVLGFAEAKPQFFYPAAFLATFEMTTLFWDVQAPLRAGLHAISHIPHYKLVASCLVLLPALFVAWLAIIIRSESRSEKEAEQIAFPKIVVGRKLSIR